MACFSSKVLGNINSYVAKQPKLEDQCDLKMNGFASDEHASFKTTSRELRRRVEEYFMKTYNLNFIEKN